MADLLVDIKASIARADEVESWTPKERQIAKYTQCCWNGCWCIFVALIPLLICLIFLIINVNREIKLDQFENCYVLERKNVGCNDGRNDEYQYVISINNEQAFNDKCDYGILSNCGMNDNYYYQNDQVIGDCWIDPSSCDISMDDPMKEIQTLIPFIIIFGLIICAFARCVRKYYLKIKTVGCWKYCDLGFSDYCGYMCYGNKVICNICDQEMVYGKLQNMELTPKCQKCEKDLIKMENGNCWYCPNMNIFYCSQCAMQVKQEDIMLTANTNNVNKSNP